MAGAKKVPLTTSNNANIPPFEAAVAGGAKKTIEQTYQKKTQLEHILLRPDTYVGSVEKHTQTLWIYENEGMVQKSITFVPGLYKIFDEILVNAADNKQRDPKMDSVKVTIDVASNSISIYNNGDGVPVEIHQEEGVYVPELIFGHLLTSSNYDDNEKKTTGGRNGYGAKLTNIFSTEFVIETADGKRQKKYKQVFSNNMGTKSEPIISKCKSSENWTKITFKPDLAKFGMTHLEDDVVALMKKRAIDVAGCLGKTVKVELNGQIFHFKSFSNYCDLYLKSASTSSSDPLPRFEEEVHERWQICISRSEGQFQQVSFVNGIATVKGGTHVDYVTNKITSHLINVIKNKNKKNKKFDLKPHTVKNHLWVFVNGLIDNPAFDSQTKETLTLRAASFGSSWDFSTKFLDKVAKSDIMKNIEEWAEFKQKKDLKKTDGSKDRRIEEFYEKRKNALLANLEDLLKYENKWRFFQGVMEGSIIVSNRKMADLFLELKEKGFTPFPKKKNAAEVAVAGSTDDTEESEENAESPTSQGVSASDYNYLISMSIGTFTVEEMKELRDERDKVMKELEDLKRSSVKSLWMKDLDALESKLDELEESDKKREKKEKDAIRQVKIAKPVIKNPRKNNKKAQTDASTNAVAEAGNDGELKKPRGKAAATKKKAPAKKVAATDDEEDDDGVLELRERMAAYNIDSSPDRLEEMQTEESQLPTSRRAAAPGKTSSSASGDNDDIEEPEENKGGRKPVKGKAAAKPPAGPKKLISEVLKPVDNSPEKKVRKMRDSPFNKKSGSILERAMNVEEEGEEEETSAEIEPVAPRARSQRHRTQVTYVISDDSENDSADNFDSEAEADNDSDFADDD